MPILEIVTFKASPEWVSDPSIIKEALSNAITAGSKAAYYGLQIEDQGKTGYLLLLWDTLEQHKTFQASASYPATLSVLRKATLGGAPADSLVHVELNKANYEKALGAPTTEIATIESLSTIPFADLTDRISLLQVAVDRTASVYAPCLLGPVTEKPSTLNLIIGWDSVEHHLDVVKTNDFKSLIDSIKQAAKVSFIHINLTKFS